MFCIIKATQVNKDKSVQGVVGLSDKLHGHGQLERSCLMRSRTATARLAKSEFDGSVRSECRQN